MGSNVLSRSQSIEEMRLSALYSEIGSEFSRRF